MTLTRKLTLGLVAAAALVTSSVVAIPEAKAGFYDRLGYYHCFWHRGIVDYTLSGYPIFGPVCD